MGQMQRAAHEYVCALRDLDLGDHDGSATEVRDAIVLSCFAEDPTHGD